MKKIISLLLTLIMAFAVGSLVACDDGDKGGSAGGETGIEYELVKQTQDDGGNYYTVSGFNISNEDAEKLATNDYEDIMVDLTIDETYNGLPVKTISSEAFLDQLLIKTITVPSTIEEIGAGAFSGCTNLEKITLPFIGEKLDAVNEKKVFGFIFGTTSKTGATEVKQAYNAKADTTTSYYIPNSLTEVVFTGETLSDYAFNAWTGLKTISFTNTALTTISTAAFKGCTGLYEFALTDSVKIVKDLAFNGCTNLLVFDFNNVEEIWENAFENCSSLNTEVDLKFPATLAVLKDGAFKNCGGLVGVDFTDSALTEIAYYAFYNCTALKNIYLKENMIIKNFAFRGCDKLSIASNVGTCTFGEFSFSEGVIGI